MSVPDAKLEECRAEVDGAITELHRRLESVESIQTLIHKIYESSEATEARLANLMISFAAYEAKQEELHAALPPEKLKVLDALVQRYIKKAELYEKLSYKLTESGLLGLIMFIVSLLGIGFWSWLQSGLHK